MKSPSVRKSSEMKQALYPAAPENYRHQHKLSRCLRLVHAFPEPFGASASRSRRRRKLRRLCIKKLWKTRGSPADDIGIIHISPVSCPCLHFPKSLSVSEEQDYGQSSVKAIYPLLLQKMPLVKDNPKKLSHTKLARPGLACRRYGRRLYYRKIHVRQRSPQCS